MVDHYNYGSTCFCVSVVFLNINNISKPISIIYQGQLKTMQYKTHEWIFAFTTFKFVLHILLIFRTLHVEENDIQDLKVKTPFS